MYSLIKGLDKVNPQTPHPSTLNPKPEGAGPQNPTDPSLLNSQPKNMKAPNTKTSNPKKQTRPPQLSTPDQAPDANTKKSKPNPPHQDIEEDIEEARLDTVHPQPYLKP